MIKSTLGCSREQLRECLAVLRRWAVHTYAGKGLHDALFDFTCHQVCE